jgi:two-component system NarL family sensor kinase
MRLSYLLLPPPPDEEGFAFAATNYVEEFSRRSKIETEISSDLPYRLPSDTEVLPFRALQESLTNIHRHSGSDRANVRAGIDGEALYLEIKDYGHGISQEVLESFKTSGNGVASLEFASDYAKWMANSTSPQVQMVPSCELACWLLTPANRTLFLRPGARSNFVHTDLPVALSTRNANTRAS